jgi:serine/threonine protein kinase
MTANGRYGVWEIVRSLDEGGMGQVFLVRNTETGQDGALKRLKNIDRKERFRREIEAVRGLTHPGVIPLLDADIDADRPYAVFEYEPGGSLADMAQVVLLDFSLSLRLRWCEFLCETLHAAHEAGVIHRDVKPENVLISEDRQIVRLCDFGLVFEEGNERITATMEQTGSRFYIAPESEEGRAEDVDRRTDIYGTGKLLYYLVSGSVYARERHRDEAYDLAVVLGSPYMEALSRVLDKSAVADRKERFDTALEMKAEIARARRIIEHGWPIPGAEETYRCAFCGDGTYRFVCISGDNQAHNRGYKEGNIGDEYMAFYECDSCGNAQRFKLKIGGEDWFPEAMERWNQYRR